MKQLKYYLHLYLECKCVVQSEQGEHILTGISYDDTQKVWWCYFENTEFRYALLEDVAPILRPLNTMTEEEWDNIEGKILIPDVMGMDALRDSFLIGTSEYRFGWEIVSDALNELRKLNIDCDGLIESGLALSNETL